MAPTSSPSQKSLLSHNSLRIAFQSLSLSQQDYISSDDLLQALQKLSNEQFDRDIFQQLWEQCKQNSQGKTKVYYFLENVIRAEAILVTKGNQIDGEIKEVQGKLKASNLRHSNRQQLTAQLHQLKQLKSGYIIDLQILRKPFKNHMYETLIIPPSISPAAAPYLQPIDRTVYNPLQTLPLPLISNKKNLTRIFLLSCIGLFLQILVFLYLNAFMNSVLFLCVFAVFLFQYFDRRTIRFLFWFDLFTLANQIVWFVIQAKNVWYTRDVGMWPDYLAPYLKMVVVVICVVFVIKLVLGVILGSQYNIDESQSQVVSICGKEIFVLRADKARESPIRKALTFGGVEGQEGVGLKSGGDSARE